MNVGLRAPGDRGMYQSNGCQLRQVRVRGATDIVLNDLGGICGLGKELLIG